MDPEDVDYVCTLSEKSVEKARKELKEDPKQRLGAVQTLRKWIRDQPHYTCRTDTTFLLTVLRRAKFSQLVSRQLIDNIMTMRTKCPDVLANLDLGDSSFLKQIELGTNVYPPKRDHEGRQIIIIRPGKIPNLSDPNFSVVNEFRLGQSLAELLQIIDEETAVNGVILVFDFTGVGMKHMTRASMEEQKRQAQIWQDCTPVRVKGFLMYNAGAIFDFMMTIMKQFLKKKNQERMQVHDTMESMYKVIPMEYWPNEYLPDDYTGPSAGSISSIAAYWKERMLDPVWRQKVLDHTSERYKIDEKKKPSTDQQVPQESFRKLNLD